MIKDEVQVVVEEQLEMCRDMWDSSSESHYTKEWLELVDSTYYIEVTFDDDGHILDTPEEIEAKVNEVAEGTVINFEVMG